MQYTVYKITNKENGKFYIGCHRTDCLDDGYMGSGKLIKRAIAKYGLDSFTKDILDVFESEEQMFDEEKNLISKLVPEYNIHEGGNGGWASLNKDPLFKERKLTYLKEARKSLKDKWDNDPAFRQSYVDRLSGVPRSVETKLKISNSSKKNPGRPHSEEAKRKIGVANAKHQKGSGNSQAGSMWITNGIENKKIKKLDIIPEEWYKGRKIIKT